MLMPSSLWLIHPASIFSALFFWDYILYNGLHFLAGFVPVYVLHLGKIYSLVISMKLLM